jgi:poly(hydroxyalkanoate) depolymerase family esterase
MNDMLDPSKMAEATRLTRAGRLAEATALLQRMLAHVPAKWTPVRRQEHAPFNDSGAVSDSKGTETALGGEPPPDIKVDIAGDIVPAAGPPLMIDATANRSTASEEPDHPPSSSGIGSRSTVRPFASAFTTARRHVLPKLSALLRVGRPGPGLGSHGLMQPAPPAPTSTPDIVPDGGRFIEATYSNPAGRRAYKLYIPSGYHEQPLPLVVMLHGCTQSPDDFAAGTRMNLIAEEQTCLVVYPAQPVEANAAKCWNWFRPSDQRRGQGEPSLIAGITRQVMRDYSVDPQRVYIGGLSAGGAAAAVMGATYPDVYAAIGVHSGLACGAAIDVPSAFAAMRQGQTSVAMSGDMSAAPGHGSDVPTIVFHGDQDDTVHPRNGDHVIAQRRTRKLQKKIHRSRALGGHAYTRTIHTDASGRAMFEHWEIHGAGHAWSGGSSAGSFTDPRGPDAAREMLRFFLEHRSRPAAL